MLVGFSGMSHLGQTLREASHLRGFKTTVTDLEDCNLVFVTQDVEDHDDLKQVDWHMRHCLELPAHVTVVVVSQVPPGYTSRWWKELGSNFRLFYQVDTIIMNAALRRATFPERFVVGCANPYNDLPWAYMEYLLTFGCPIVKMTYESAELTKLAINYYLSKQIEATNELARVADRVGASWHDMIEGIKLDKRMGGYLIPGDPRGGHLARDVKTIEKMLGGNECMTHSSSVATAK